MSDELDSAPTRELQERAEQLGDQDWGIVMEAATALARAEQAGIAAVRADALLRSPGFMYAWLSLSGATARSVLPVDPG